MTFGSDDKKGCFNREISPWYGGVKITPVCFCAAAHGAGSLGGGELGHSLGALGHGVLGQLARQDEAHSGLDLARGHCGLLVVAGQLGGLSGNLLEDVSDEGVQDGDGPGGDTSVRVDLQDSKCSKGQLSST